MLTRIVINNFRQFEHISVPLDPTLNILVGNNDAGKSTILQAIEVALSGRIGGRRVEDELSPHWFPKSVSAKYLAEIRRGNSAAKLPRIEIEAYFACRPHLAHHQGDNNSLRQDCPGIAFECFFDPAFEEQYSRFLRDAAAIHSVPTEFCRFSRTDFASNGIAGNRHDMQCAVIDSSTLRLQSGTDYYLRKTIDEHLPEDVRARMSLALRTYREELSKDPAFVEANEAIGVERNTLHKQSVRLATDSSARSAWEAGIVPHLDEVPFGYVGKGEQAAFKTLLALDKETKRAVVLVEEPENHLSFANLSALIERLVERTENRQLIVTTHSSFVLNKLGIDNLRLIKNQRVSTLAELPQGTRDYFSKLSGYDTLRMVLANATILVEGPSDELIVQKAYLQEHGRLPLADGIDVLSVQALAFRRFLELGRQLSARIAVVTDLDDDASDMKARKRFRDFEVPGVVKGFVGQLENGRTLEPQLIKSASGGLIAEILGMPYTSDSDLADQMAAAKTDAALAIFNSPETVPMPDYIMSAIAFVR